MTTHFVSPPEREVYNATVWEIVRQIPVGKVSTYGQIAAMIPPTGRLNLRTVEAFGARWVGGAMAACPSGVPWQRVINSQGKISLREGAEKQRELLEAEGVLFDERGRVNLGEFGWDGPPEAWLKAHGLLPPPRFSRPAQTTMDL
jgi:methylated-DNA-protein-cysteine methyltransferase-like protein